MIGLPEYLPQRPTTVLATTTLTGTCVVKFRNFEELMIKSLLLSRSWVPFQNIMTLGMNKSTED
jgi:hypothetical protein